MFKLLMLSPGFFQVLETRGTFSGTLEEIASYLKRFNVLEEEINLAISDMRSKGNNIADFGVGYSGSPKFIFSEWNSSVPYDGGYVA